MMLLTTAPFLTGVLSEKKTSQKRKPPEQSSRRSTDYAKQCYVRHWREAVCLRSQVGYKTVATKSSNGKLIYHPKQEPPKQESYTATTITCPPIDGLKKKMIT